MTAPVSVAAIDLGATSGRVVHARVGADTLELTEVHRFPNGALLDDAGALRWNVSALYAATLEGLTAAIAQHPDIASIGIDSWAVDYGLLRRGELVEEPYSYRDPRTARGVELVHAVRDHSELYAGNGLQFLPFNSLYQLAADRERGMLESVDRALLVPDLIAYWLTGQAVTERTNASTTGLLDLRSRPSRWDDELLDELGLASDLLAPLVEPGDTIGEVTDEVAARIGGRPTVTAVGSHDTASAVAGIPATTPHFAYISSGTWSLVGVELHEPVLTAESAAAGFTNEGGVDGRVRYLHNVMGLWLLSESLRTWELAGTPVDLDGLLTAAAQVSTPVGIFDADDERLLPPGDMPERIAQLLSERSQPIPANPAELARSIFESLAAKYASTIADAVRLTGTRVDVVHIVGGGSQSELLCQLTADRTGLPVLAGPVEATAIGNVLIQARSLGALQGDLDELRRLVSRTNPPRRFEPRKAR